MYNVVVLSLEKKFYRYQSKLQALIIAAMRHEKTPGLVEVYLLGDKLMNKNVLSYPAPPDFPRPDLEQKILGEIYLNPDYIKAKKEDLDFMALHGFLHLLGYDHKKKSDTIKMETKEKKLLRALSP